ncbi:MAG: hypothetical protein MI974_33180 [Chitinophagales bacterium]|nr:hypothetical protein [Chitinophagales bacterium]
MKSLNFIAFTLIIFASSCTPDQVTPGEPYCSAGRSVLTVNDSDVDAAVKEAIYTPDPALSIVHIEDSRYNHNGRVVIIPTSFPNAPANPHVTTELIEETFFTTGVGSVNDFFLENSWGQYSLSNVGISEPVAMPMTRDQYAELSGSGFIDSWEMYRDACQNSSIDWDVVDANSDLVITADEALLFFLHPLGHLGAVRCPSYFEIDYQGNTYSIQRCMTNADCKRADDELSAEDPIEYNFSTICHEFAHGLFSLPDRYTGGICGTGGPGQFDLMSESCSKRHLSVFDKMKIGWIQPRILLPREERQCLSFPAIETTPAALVLYNPEAPDECYIVVNRNKESSARDFESGLPDSGLAVWWANNQTGALHLVHFSDPARIPSSYTSAGIGDLFKYKEGISPEAHYLLLNEDGSFRFSIRAISEPGAIMYAEF